MGKWEIHKQHSKWTSFVHWNCLSAKHLLFATNPNFEEIVQWSEVTPSHLHSHQSQLENFSPWGAASLPSCWVYLQFDFVCFNYCSNLNTVTQYYSMQFYNCEHELITDHHVEVKCIARYSGWKGHKISLHHEYTSIFAFKQIVETRILDIKLPVKWRHSFTLCATRMIPESASSLGRCIHEGRRHLKGKHHSPCERYLSSMWFHWSCLAAKKSQ